MREIIIETDRLTMYDRFHAVRKRSEMLAAPLQTEDYIPQPVHFASPPKWHLAHVTWFFEQFILSPFLPDYEVFHEDFSFLFNSYYNTIGERTFRADRGVITRPTVAQVRAYRSYVDEHMKQLLEQNESADLAALVEIGINHEQQHQELFITDLKHTFSLNPLYPVYDESMDLASDTNLHDSWTSVDEGIYEIGYAGNGFCFDNELGRHKAYLPAFEISSALVTCGEYMAFMEAGGYSDFRFWLDEGWAWVCESKKKAPLYWEQEAGVWYRYSLAGRKEIQREEILSHISYYEAEAYARWRGLRLPTEQEWEVAAPDLDWGQRWEWTGSAYLPYPGFETADGALGEYNGKFMVNQMVLRGASWATASGHSRISYRNFFHPHFQWQFTGIRLARHL